MGRRRHRFLIGLFVPLAAASSVARAQLGGTQPGGLASGAPMASSQGCSSCHGGLQAMIGEDLSRAYMPWDTWAGSMMANAARDPLFLASLTVAEQDAPSSGTYCLRCHTPSAFVESRATPGDGSRLSDIDREGVHCAVCHRSVDASRPPTSNPDAPLVGNAQLFFDLGETTEATYHGPYDDPGSSPAHFAVGDPFVTDDSRLCGQCHQVDNPDEHLYDAAGRDTGRPFPLDTTFEEWQSSSFASGAGAKSCQACHMPVEPGMHQVATGALERLDPPRHDFVGGNEWGPALLKAAFPGLRDDEYDRTRAAARESLMRAAKLEIRSLPAEGTAGKEIALAVRVTNLTGHKLPTGYADGRRAWLEVTVVDGTGTENVLSGGYDGATAELREDTQLRVYEAVHGRDGAPEDHIVRHRQILRDTRIPPEGFRASPTTEPVGAISFSDGAGGFHAYDDASYQVKLPAATAPVTVRVRLMFQAVTAAHVAALAAANTTDSRGTALMALWQQTGKAAPFMMGEVTQSVEVRAASVPPGSPGQSPGCGCALASGPQAAGPAGAALLAAAWLRGRARRRSRSGRGSPSR